jgi:glycosyltransferase involved in cell wall biosynthesis
VTAVARPSLAVLICYYNEGPLLTRALDTLFAQEERPDEVIVYDNSGCGDAEQHIPPDRPVTLLRGKENRGPSFARNRMAEVARSEYLHFHDADDVFAPGFVAEIKSAIQNGPIDFVLNQVRVIYENSVKDVIYCPLNCERETLFDLVVYRGIWLPAGTIRAGIVHSGCWFDENLWYNEDSEFYWRVSALVAHWRVIDTPLIHIIARSGTHGSFDPSKRRIHVLDSLEKAASWFPESHRAPLAAGASSVALDSWRAGDRDIMDRAVKFAASMGGLSFPHRPVAYRILAECGAIGSAELLSRLYRRLRPSRLQTVS